LRAFDARGQLIILARNVEQVFAQFADRLLLAQFTDVSGLVSVMR
jgi:hypothetical protein